MAETLTKDQIHDYLNPLITNDHWDLLGAPEHFCEYLFGNAKIGSERHYKDFGALLYLGGESRQGFIDFVSTVGNRLHVLYRNTPHEEEKAHIASMMLSLLDCSVEQMAHKLWSNAKLPIYRDDVDELKKEALAIIHATLASHPVGEKNGAVLCATAIQRHLKEKVHAISAGQPHPVISAPRRIMPSVQPQPAATPPAPVSPEPPPPAPAAPRADNVMTASHWFGRKRTPQPEIALPEPDQRAYILPADAANIRAARKIHALLSRDAAESWVTNARRGIMEKPDSDSVFDIGNEL